MKKFHRMQLELIRSMMNLLEEQSLEKTTVQDITGKLELHRSTFYQYYTDKYELTQDMLIYLSQELATKNVESIDVIAEIVGFIMEYHTVIYNATYANTKIQPLIDFENVFSDVIAASMSFELETLPLKLIAQGMMGSFLAILRMYHEKSYAWTKQELYDGILAISIILQQ